MEVSPTLRDIWHYSTASRLRTPHYRDVECRAHHRDSDGDGRRDNETTVTQLQVLLTSKGYSLSLSTIQRSGSRQGWTFRGSAYYQPIRHANKEKRLAWARENLTASLTDGFTDVVWTEEASIQLESHRRHCFRKSGCQPRPKPRYACTCSWTCISGAHAKGLRSYKFSLSPSLPSPLPSPPLSLSLSEINIPPKCMYGQALAG